MAINPIDPSYTIENSSEVNKKVNAPEEKTSPDMTDKVDLSPEAKKLHDAQTQSKLSEIRGKILSGFYNSDEVMNSVASSLLKVIKQK